MTLSPSVELPSSAESSIDAASAWQPAFPSAQLVTAAASMFTGHKIAERDLRQPIVRPRELTQQTDAQRQELRDWMRSVGIEPEPIDQAELQRALLPGRAPYVPPDPGVSALPGITDRELVEGPRWRIMIGPGMVSVRHQDPARAERAAQRAVEDMIERRRMEQAGLLPEVDGLSRASITVWSPRSRARMVQAFAALDWSPLLDGIGPGEVPAMVTLTYPGDWLTVAPSAAASKRHLDLLRQRYTRAWGRKLVGVWKREFQRRGAPHYHLLMVPPHGRRNGLEFPQWLSETWARIVAAPDPEERRRHRLAGTGVDYHAGLRAKDPAAVGVYFTKHSTFAAKEYQNEAPAEWVEQGTVGRFWGVWGLSRAVHGAIVAPEEARAADRTLRRYSRANARLVRVPVFRYRTKVDRDTGEVRAVWRKSTKLVRIYRMRTGQGGYLVVKDGPALASQLARHLDQLYRPGSVVSRSGAGPVGFLP